MTKEIEKTSRLRDELERIQEELVASRVNEQRAEKDLLKEKTDAMSLRQKLTLALADKHSLTEEKLQILSEKERLDRVVEVCISVILNCSEVVTKIICPLET